MSKPRTSLWISLVAVLAFGPACFLSREHVNMDLEAEAIAQLVPGTTTARQVVESLGAPAEVVQLGRRSAYRYEHSQRKVAGLWAIVIVFVNQDTQSDRTWIFFDENDVVTHVGTTLDASEAEYAMPWVGHD